MLNPTLYFIAENYGHAHRMLEVLHKLGIAKSSVSLIAPKESPTNGPDNGFMVGAGEGGLLGGTLGWLAGMGTDIIAGVGPFLMAGPISALIGATMGAAVGGICGGLIRLGIPKSLARRYERRVKAGNILVSVQAVNLLRADQAGGLLEEAGARDILVSPTPVEAQVMQEAAPKS